MSPALMPPVLLIAFNRPDLAERTFDRIRQAAPSRLYVATDAARPLRSGEADRVRQTRQITSRVDWACELTRLDADTNMGCGRRISSAISEVLRHHESVIILEDDCLPDPTFFDYCSRLLDRYRLDQRVMAISGDNFQGNRLPKRQVRHDASYTFSKYPHCWGWATWRRAWQHFDLSMSAWPRLRDSGLLETMCETDRERRFWQTMLDQTHAGKIDTWDLQWTLSCWAQSGLTILPAENLVSNIGFRDDGTHTTERHEFAELPTVAMDRLVHPEEVVRDAVADRWTDQRLYSGPWQLQHRKSRNPIRRWHRSLMKRIA